MDKNTAVYITRKLHTPLIEKYPPKKFNHFKSKILILKS